MKKYLRHYAWLSTHGFSYLLGWPALARFHHALALFGLHGLGYGNNYSQTTTGEAWFLRNVLAKENIGNCIDVGANVGNYSLLLLRYAAGTVYAVEPLSSSFEVLERNAIDRIRAFHLAISDRTGTAHIYSKGKNWEGASLSRELVENRAIDEEVPVTTLDAFVSQNRISEIDFIKIDTEGHEREVLSGMQQIIAEVPPRYIQFEYGQHHLAHGQTLFSLTKLLPGYRFYRLMSHGMIPIDSNKIINNIFMYCNIIAKRIE